MIRIEIDDENINDLQRNTIDATRDRLRRAKSVDIVVRKDGQDYRFQADWLKHARFYWTVDR